VLNVGSTKTKSEEYVRVLDKRLVHFLHNNSNNNEPIYVSREPPS